MHSYQRISHKGKGIFFFDYRGLRGKEVLEQLQSNTRMILDSPQTDFLTLSDFRNVYADEESMAYLQSEGS